MDDPPEFHNPKPPEATTSTLPVETEFQVGFGHITAAAELTRLPLNLQNEINGCIADHCGKAGIHGIIHRELERERLNEILAAYLIKELAKDADPFEIEYRALTGKN